jgi:hypothetical protein
MMDAAEQLERFTTDDAAYVKERERLVLEALIAEVTTDETISSRD